MDKARVETFSDSVMAVIITVMVLDLKAPHGHDLAALEAVLPGFATYALSFVFVAIYWNNHHHMLHAAVHVDGRVLWANLLLLFWLALVPFVTSWASEDLEAPLPTALYGAVLLLSGLSYLLLERALVRVGGRDSALARAVGRDLKGKISAILYVPAIALAFVRTWMADAIIVLVAVIWFIPDPRIEHEIHAEATHTETFS
jgi:uncharacterized membrane protein